jgi:predicted aspartyl protease
MRIDEMGKVLVPARIESLEDLFRVQQGAIPNSEVRRVDVPDALVDTGAIGLMMPKKYVSQLGLRPLRTQIGRTVGGDIPMTIYNAVRLTVDGRDCSLDVYEIADHHPVLIGQIPLEALDFVVDPVNRRLIGNPDHGGQHMADALGFCEFLEK